MSRFIENFHVVHTFRYSREDGTHAVMYSKKQEGGLYIYILSRYYKMKFKFVLFFRDIIRRL